MTELGDFRRLFMERRFTGFFRGFLPAGRFFHLPYFGFHYRAPRGGMLGDTSLWRADRGLCQWLHGALHGNLHGRLNLGFFHRRSNFTGCRGSLTLGFSDNGGLFCGFRHLTDLGTPGWGDWLSLGKGFLFRNFGE